VRGFPVSSVHYCFHTEIEQTDRSDFFCGVYAPHEGAVVTLYCEMITACYGGGVVTTTIRRPFDNHSTVFQRSLRSH